MKRVFCIMTRAKLCTKSILVQSPLCRHKISPMMKRSVFLELIHLNNQGVDEFTTDQEYAGACRLFQEALQLLHTVCTELNSGPALKSSTGDDIISSPHHSPASPAQDEESTTDNTMAATTNTPDAATNNASPAREIRPTPPAYTKGQNPSRIVESTLYVSSRPIALSSSSTLFHSKTKNSESLFTEKKITILSIFVTFNLALSQHVMSFHAPPEKASKLHHSAIRLYNVVLNLRIKRAPRCFKRHGNPFVLFDISLLNNMGALHDELGNGDCTRHFFRKLDETLRRQVGPTHPLRDEVHGFVGNVNLVLQIAHWESKPASAA